MKYAMNARTMRPSANGRLTRRSINMPSVTIATSARLTLGSTPGKYLSNAFTNLLKNLFKALIDRLVSVL